MSCQNCVNPMSSSNTLGQRLDRKIQSLSRHCPLTLKLMPFFMLDKLWTQFGLGKYGLRVLILGFSRIYDIGQFCSLWTKTSFMLPIAQSPTRAHCPHKVKYTRINCNWSQCNNWSLLKMMVTVKYDESSPTY